MEFLITVAMLAQITLLVIDTSTNGDAQSPANAAPAAANGDSRVSMRSMTKLEQHEELTASGGKENTVVYRPYTYRDQRVYYSQPGYYQQPQWVNGYYYMNGYYYSPSYYYSYPAYAYGSTGWGGAGGGAGGGLFGFCLICFGLG